MTVILDAGALVAIERGDRDMIAIVKRERRAGRPPMSNGGVVGQVWRGGRDRQANLARFLQGVDVRPIDDEAGRAAGVVLGRAATADVIDATVVLLAVDGDEVYTSDPDDLARLAVAAQIHVDLVSV